MVTYFLLTSCAVSIMFFLSATSLACGVVQYRRRYIILCSLNFAIMTEVDTI
jgi:hypothetical protein